MGNDRARQFLPFDALKGFREALKEKERIKVAKIELSEDEEIIISNRLTQVKKGMIVKIVHYSNQEYIETTGMVSKIDLVYHKLTIVKLDIFFNDILKIESNEFIEEY